MKKQKLDLAQTIETLKKSLCDEAILSAQQNGREHATKAASFAKTLKEKEIFMTSFVALKKNLKLNIRLYCIS